MVRQLDKEISVKQDPSSISIAGGSLLIVEEYDKIRTLYANFFEKNNYRVYSTVRIQDAAAIAHSVLPNTIFIDFNLVRERVLEIIEKLHQIVPGATIIVFGTSDSEEMKSTILSHGASIFTPLGIELSKSVT